MQIMYIKALFTYIIETLNIVGISIIVLGMVYSSIHYFASTFGLFVKSKTHAMDLTKLRSEICNSIILGLDFMVGATVIESVISPGYTVAEPDYHSLGLAALMILVRILFSFYVDKELETLELKVKK